MTETRDRNTHRMVIFILPPLTPRSRIMQASERIRREGAFNTFVFTTVDRPCFVTHVFLSRQYRSKVLTFGYSNTEKE